MESILLHSKSSSVPIEDAKKWYARQKSNRLLTDEDILSSINVTPDWDYIQIVPFKDSTDLLMVPIKDTLNDIFPKAIVQLVFYYDSLSNITSSLFVIEPFESYYSSHGNVYHTHDFCGVSININQEGCIENMIKYDSGTMFQINADSIPESVIIETRGDPTSNCPIWGKSKHKSQWWRKFMKWLNNNTGGGGMSDGDWAEGGSWWNDNWDGNQLPPFNGSGSGNGNSGWNTNPNGSSGGFGSSMFINYFTDAVFESSQYRDQVKKCKGNFIYSNDVNTPVIFSIDKSIFGFGYKLFVGAYDYYLDQLSQGNTNFQLKDAFAIVQTPPSTYKFFPNPFNLAQWKPKIEPIYQKMKKDFEEHKNCTGSLNTGPDGNSSCDCFEYMIEDVKEDFLRKYCRLTKDEVEFLFRHPEYQAEVVNAASKCTNAGSDYFECVNDALLQYFYQEEGVETIDGSDSGPFYDGTKQICTEMFEFTIDKENDVLWTCGLKDFKVKFVGNNGIKYHNFKSPFFHAASTNNCPINLPITAANALNHAYANTIILWNSNQLQDSNGNPLSIEKVYMLQASSIFRSNVLSCAGDKSGLFNSLNFLDPASRPKKFFDHGTKWLDFQNEFSQKCQ